MSAIAWELPEEIRAVREGLLEFARQEVLTRHEKHHDLFENPRRLYREDGRFSDELKGLIGEVRRAAAKAGYYNMCVPEALGGGGLGHLAYYVGWEALFHLCGPQNWLMLYVISHWAFGPSRLLEKVTPEAREKMLAPMMAGEASMCFGLSEPGAGSDAAALATKAVPDGNAWRITGRKIWTSNSPVADYCIVFAITDPARAAQRKGGISAFLVPTSSPGVGYGRWALEKALDYAQTRKAFDKPIADYQGVTFPLAESATELHAAHLMGLNVATLLDRGEAAVKELSMTKAFSVQVGYRAVDRAMQTHGAMGFTNEVGLHHAWHSLRIVNVADGTNEILNRSIVQRLLRGDTEV